MTDIEGKVTGALALVTDITERKATDTALRESEERLHKITGEVSDAIMIHQSGFILYANPAAAALLGVQNADELVGVNSFTFTHPDDRPVLIERMKTLFQTPATSFLPRIRQRIVRKNGDFVQVESSTTTITFNGKSALLVIARQLKE